MAENSSEVSRFIYLHCSFKIDVALDVTQILRNAFLEIYFKEYFVEQFLSKSMNLFTLSSTS